MSTQVVIVLYEYTQLFTTKTDRLVRSMAERRSKGMNTPRQGPDGGTRTLQADRLAPSGVQAHGSTAISQSLAFEQIIIFAV